MVVVSDRHFVQKCIKAQHPEKGVLVVGEAISINQGWTEGALDSVKAVLTKKWINNEC